MASRKKVAPPEVSEDTSPPREPTVGDVGVHVTWHRHVRSNLARDIERYWCGDARGVKDGKSFIGLQYVTLEDGLVQAGRYTMERTDVLWVRVPTLGEDAGVAVVYPNGTVQLDWCDDSHEHDDVLRAAGQIAYSMDKEFCEAQKAWLDARPWMDAIGKTPEEAVRAIRAHDVTFD